MHASFGCEFTASTLPSCEESERQVSVFARIDACRLVGGIEDAGQRDIEPLYAVLVLSRGEACAQRVKQAGFFLSDSRGLEGKLCQKASKEKLDSQLSVSQCRGALQLGCGVVRTFDENTQDEHVVRTLFDLASANPKP